MQKPDSTPRRETSWDSGSSSHRARTSETLKSGSKSQLSCLNNCMVWTKMTLDTTELGFPVVLNGNSNGGHHLRICDNYLHKQLGLCLPSPTARGPHHTGPSSVPGLKATLRPLTWRPSQEPPPLPGMGPLHLCSPSQLIRLAAFYPSGLHLKVTPSRPSLTTCSPSKHLSASSRQCPPHAVSPGLQPASTSATFHAGQEP